MALVRVIIALAAILAAACWGLERLTPEAGGQLHLSAAVADPGAAPGNHGDARLPVSDECQTCTHAVTPEGAGGRALFAAAHNPN